jgi:hypothetical protein
MPLSRRQFLRGVAGTLLATLVPTPVPVRPVPAQAPRPLREPYELSLFIGLDISYDCLEMHFSQLATHFQQARERHIWQTLIFQDA